jgi:hypothetical protein
VAFSTRRGGFDSLTSERLGCRAWDVQKVTASGHVRHPNGVSSGRSCVCSCDRAGRDELGQTTLHLFEEGGDEDLWITADSRTR